MESDIQSLYWIPLFSAYITVYEIPTPIFPIFPATTYSCVLWKSNSARAHSSPYYSRIPKKPAIHRLAKRQWPEVPRPTHPHILLLFPNLSELSWRTPTDVIGQSRRLWSGMTLNDRRTPWARTPHSCMLSCEDEGRKLDSLGNARVVPTGKVY